MTAVTAVTDHTDQADRPEGDRPGGDRPEDGRSGDGRSNSGRPEGGRRADGRPGDGHSEGGVLEDVSSGAGATGAERDDRSGDTKSTSENRPENDPPGTASSGARSPESGDRTEEAGTSTPNDGPAGQGTARNGSDAERRTRGEGGEGEDPARAEDGPVWDDGLIARRVAETAPGRYQTPPAEARAAVPAVPAPLAYDGPLRSRLDALRELVGLSRARLDSGTLAEAGRVLDEAAARRRLSGEHTVVAIAGATGSGKSQLFNALAGVAISETGVRRPTTAAPIACTWSDGAATLIDRLGIPGRLRRLPVAERGGRGTTARPGPGRPARPRLRRRPAPRTGGPRPGARRRGDLGGRSGEVRGRRPP